MILEIGFLDIYGLVDSEYTFLIYGLVDPEYIFLIYGLTNMECNFLTYVDPKYIF